MNFFNTNLLHRVDWSIGAGTINYVTARNRVPQVADQLARFLNFLVTNGSTQMNRVNVAGHSLGAHIAGLAGKRVTQGRIHVIFALDPAGLLFSLNSPNDRFEQNDAVYTEGIRTNAGGLGFDDLLAHADFYPNWGSRFDSKIVCCRSSVNKNCFTSQPGCGLDVSGSCAHSRAHQFFAEAINSNRFVGRRCTGYQQITSRNCPGTGETASMGIEPGSIGLRGVYFLETNSNTPFARG